MGRNILRQETQIRNSDAYDDTLAAGSTLESNPTDLQDDLDGLRSQIKRILNDSSGNWYDDIPTVNSKQRDLTDLNTDLDDLEIKPILRRAQLLTDVSVPASQNYVVLSVASTETPSETAAVGAVTTEGAVVANHTGTFGSHSLDEVAGPNAIHPDNLVVVVDASSGDPILSSGRKIYGLLQSESATDGHTFNDTTNQVQISFVRINSTHDDLEAVPAGDIESTDINYKYTARFHFDNIPEHAFLVDAPFVDLPAGTTVTLDNAIDNQSGAATQVQNIDVRISDTFSWAFQDSTGGADILRVDALAAGDEVELNVAEFDVNNTNDADFSGGASFDTSGTSINVGSTTGQIDAAASLTLAATGGSSDLTLSSGLETKFVDGNKSGSTFAGDLKLSETSTEWDNYETEFGEVSILNALVQAKQETAEARADYEVTSNIAADADFDPGVNATLINGSTPDLTGLDFATSQVKIFVNGQLMVGGANAAANNDVYPGTDLTNGELKFEFNLVGTAGRRDQVTVITSS